MELKSVSPRQERTDSNVLSDNRRVHPDKLRGVLSFHNVRYSVTTGKCCKKRTKQILRNVSGIFEPGLNVIMGPTGGGKTSLLDLLAQRRDISGVDGTLLLNGAPLPRDFKVMSGYVVQHDVVMGTMTVRENLMFAALLRMPPPRSTADLNETVDQLIEQLGLSHCKDTKIGTQLIKGVSGGERKRTNIGLELVLKPKILFLDEPTTGLDSNTSLTVISILKKLALNENRTIIFSIHQPRFSIFKLFDTLHLLSSFGQTVYHGPAMAAVEYFKRHSFECETFNNPPDFFLDIIIENSDVSRIQAGKPKEKYTADDSKRDLAALFRESQENATLEGRLEQIIEECGFDSVVNSPGFRASWPLQCLYLSKRSILNYLRNPQTSIMPIIIFLFIGILMGVVFFDTKTDLSGFQNLYGCQFFVAIHMLFGNMAATELFIVGRAHFLHELANGYYQPSSFFVSKLFTDILPMRGFPVLVFSPLVYFMVGLKRDVGLFFFFMLTNLVATMAACSVVFPFSVVTGVFAVATALTGLTFTVMLVFAGHLINTSSLPVALQWIQHVSIPRYTLATLAASQITGLQFCGDRTSIVDGQRVTNYTCEIGEELLHSQDIRFSTWDQWRNLLILLLITLILFGLSYLKIASMTMHK